MNTQPTARTPGTAHARRRGRWAADTGSASVEMVLLAAPVSVLVLLAAVFCWRVAATRVDADSAAMAGARAASLARSPAAARTAAIEAATATLTGQDLTCAALTVAVDTSRFTWGGQVGVTVSCTITTSDLAGLAVPGSITFEGRSTSPVDQWREIDGTAP